jgi:Dehydrogenases with different specificities (related to short-chain alcohol dehydrogenases)
MLNSKKGSIVNISSIAGINALENRAAYMSSKWGLIGLASSLAIDFSPKNIRVNTICPGYVKTPLVNDYINSLSNKSRNKLIKSHLIGRLGKPEDISQCATFLLSSESSWITGAVIPVDGGYTIGSNSK